MLRSLCSYWGPLYLALSSNQSPPVWIIRDGPDDSFDGKVLCKCLACVHCLSQSAGDIFVTYASDVLPYGNVNLLARTRPALATEFVSEKNMLLISACSKKSK